MEKVNFNYSTKNIPVPSNNLYLQIMINKIEKFVHNLRWKSHFYLKPANNPPKKETFGFKSTAPAPFVMEIKEFETKLVDLVRNIKFGRKPNLFQQKLKQDEKKLKLCPHQSR